MARNPLTQTAIRWQTRKAIDDSPGHLIPWAWYVIAFLFPVVGLAAAIYYMGKPEIMVVEAFTLLVVSMFPALLLLLAYVVLK